jgi:hypothetical protein
MPCPTKAAEWQVPVSSQVVQRICRNDQASLQVKLRLRGSEVRMLMASLGAESLRPCLQLPWAQGAMTRLLRAPWPHRHGTNTACSPRSYCSILARDADVSPTACTRLRMASLNAVVTPVMLDLGHEGRCRIRSRTEQRDAAFRLGCWECVARGSDGIQRVIAHTIVCHP